MRILLLFLPLLFLWACSEDPIGELADGDEFFDSQPTTDPDILNDRTPPDTDEIPDTALSDETENDTAVPDSPTLDESGLPDMADTDSAIGSDTENSDDEESPDDIPLPDEDTAPPIPVCEPLATEECSYSGPAGTQNVGPCKTGTRQCAVDGMSWSECSGEVLPVTEICNNGSDDNCNGTADEDFDADGDGWTVCGGDCCDTIAQCGDPAKVNPGAIEVAGDGVDNDCNGQTDEAFVSCSTADLFVGTEATDLLHAMDICQVSTNGSWGIVGTPTLTRADGTTSNYSGPIDNLEIAVMEQLGSDASNLAISGGTMAALSTGQARDSYDDPNKTTTTSYVFDNYDRTPPTDFIAAHGNALPATRVGCPKGQYAKDSVMLSVQLKVPTNAYSLSFNLRFFSQEYKTYTCTDFNDFFIAMLYSGASGIPADKNISFDESGNYISVNTYQFFTVCTPKTGYDCPDGTDALAGTGFTATNGGATKWLKTVAPVLPGETITLKFVIWDTKDWEFDSLVLLDNFRWSAEGTTAPITYECWDANRNGECDPEEDFSGDGSCTERDC